MGTPTRDSREEGAQGAWVTQPAQAPVRQDQGLLDGVLSERSVTACAVGDSIEEREVRLYQPGEGVTVPVQGSFQEGVHSRTLILAQGGREQFQLRESCRHTRYMPPPEAPLK